MSQAHARDYRYVEDIVTQSKSSFAMGMKVLPEDRRGYLFAVYAYCRKLDDIADEPESPVVQHQKLDDWARRIDQMKAGNPACEITRVLWDAHETCHLPLEELDLLIEGMRMDVNGPIIAPSWDELYDYCRKVAISVGLLSLPLFGRHDDGAQAFAHEVGYALQLTNILRDIIEDGDNGRLYLPHELLKQHNIAPDPKKAPRDGNLTNVLRAIAEKVQGHYAKAQVQLDQIGTENLKPAILMMIVYQKTFEKMQKRGWHVLSPRMRLSKGEKALLVMKSLARL